MNNIVSYNPKVSVIIPVYNVEKYIERCARSLLEQSLKDIEYPLAELNKRIFKSANRFVVNVVYILKDCKCTYFP